MPLFPNHPRRPLQSGGAWRMIAAAVVHMCNLTSGPGWLMSVLMGMGIPATETF